MKWNKLAICSKSNCDSPSNSDSDRNPSQACTLLIPYDLGNPAFPLLLTNAPLGHSPFAVLTSIVARATQANLIQLVATPLAGCCLLCQRERLHIASQLYLLHPSASQRSANVKAKISLHTDAYGSVCGCIRLHELLLVYSSYWGCWQRGSISTITSHNFIYILIIRVAKSCWLPSPRIRTSVEWC